MINLEFQLEREDHVTFQLYIASKSERIKKKRRTTKYRVPIVYLVLASIIFFVGELGLSIVFILVGILWYLFYPKYELKRYEKHYRSYVEENFKTELDPKVIIEFTETVINTTDEKGNSSIKIETIKEIDEIEKYFFIRLNPGLGLIIPKSKITDLGEFELWLNEITKRYGIKRNVDFAWRWK
ncbi:YcxB family protein [uncultured Draconibacterium sp.]|uniref:YcxB family protein n=1 Tax=uncultured Draconibacterium sp. TaxID=1573823 RepID=UPI0029C9905F|nr:YcxB family protein [uncultured Draconibacterium sp.]